jgi:hypothetical protein
MPACQVRGSRSKTEPKGTVTWEGGRVLRRSSRTSEMMSQVGTIDSRERQYCSEGLVAAWEPSQNSVDLGKRREFSTELM